MVDLPLGNISTLRLPRPHPTLLSIKKSMKLVAILLALTSQVSGSEAPLYAHCDHWCDSTTCAKDQCSECPICNVQDQNNYCASWCNVYTCESRFSAQYCDGCCVCQSLKARAHCEPWCNSFTCWVRGGYCSGCVSCGGNVVATSQFE